MRLQSVILPQDEECHDLYCRGALSLDAGASLSFDTYYNCFCYTKYRDYTTISQVEFSCRISGKAKVQLCVYDGSERVICEAGGEGELTISAALLDLPGNGFLYPKITALTCCDFLGGEYSADCSPADISCCIAVCTYKREQYVLSNIERLKGFEFSFIDRVFVVDNGKTLDCRALSDELVTVLPNRNYGGSGGFTRGLIEAHDGGFSHIILMDDDVEFYPQTLEQMTVFMSLLKKEHSDCWLSAAMIPLDKQWEQYELGAVLEKHCVIRHNKNGADIRKKEYLLDNLDNPTIDYGAWWTLCMPVSVMEKGLPFPFFIKLDDVEYGIRHNAEIITMNGISVRHEAFDNKYSMHLEYYNVRNQLVLNAAHNNAPTRNALYRLFAVTFKHLVLYRYDSIPIILKAFSDYLKGVDFFLGCDEEKLNREIMQSVPRLTPLTNIPEWNEQMRSIPRVKNYKVLTPSALLTMAGHIVPSFLLKKGVSAAPISMAGANDTLFRKRIIQYQYKGDTGIVTERNFAKFVKYSFMTLGMTVRLICLSPRAKKSYRDRKTEISSSDFWRKHLGI